MRLIHEAQVFERFPAHVTGAIRVRPVLVDAAVHAGKELTDRGPGPSVAETVRHWGDVYRAMGAKPKYESSLAKLLSEYAESGMPAPYKPLVDFYAVLSLVAGAPMAAYDVRFLAGDLRLVSASKAHRELVFSPLRQPKDSQHLRSGEVAYVDNEKIVCRYWNMGDCHETRLRHEGEEDGPSSDVLFVLDLVDLPRGSARTQFDTVADDCRRWFPQAVVAAGITDADTPGLDLDA